MEEGGPAGVDSTLTFENSDNMVELPIINYDQKQVWNYQLRDRWTWGTGLKPRVLFVYWDKFYLKVLSPLHMCLKLSLSGLHPIKKLFLKIICSNIKIGIEIAVIAFRGK